MSEATCIRNFMEISSACKNVSFYPSYKMRLISYLCHLFTVDLGAEWGLGQQDVVLCGVDTELVEKGVMPDLLHVVPVGDDTLFDGVAERQDSSPALCLLSDVAVILPHANHDPLGKQREEQNLNIALLY